MRLYVFSENLAQFVYFFVTWVYQLTMKMGDSLNMLTWLCLEVWLLLHQLLKSQNDIFSSYFTVPRWNFNFGTDCIADTLSFKATKQAVNSIKIYENSEKLSLSIFQKVWK